MEARHRASILALARRQARAETDPEVVRALGVVAAHGGDLLLALDELTSARPEGAAPERETQQAKLRAERLFECLLESLSEKLMVRPGVAGELESHRGSVLGCMAAEATAEGQITSAVSVLGPVLGRGAAVATAVFLYKLPIGFVSANPFRKIHRVTHWPATPGEPPAHGDAASPPTAEA